VRAANLIIMCLFIFLFLAKAKTVQAQTDNSAFKNEEPTLTKKQKRKQVPKYYGISFGINRSKFRDFATSPLFYIGTSNQIALSRLKMGNNRETELSLSYDFGSYSANFNETTTFSNVKRVVLNYSQLYRVGLLNSVGINTKVGFLINGSGNLRINGSLQNNALGVDIFVNAMGAIKITKDISRRVVKEKKFLFWRYKLNEKKRNLAFRLNLGLINSSYRNGYVYNGQSEILNDPKSFDDYEFEIFSGIRASTSLDYTRYLKNKNAFQFSYIWDAYATSGAVEKFEMAHHTFRLSLLFNTNNR